jgi:hypothetical protein
MAWFCGSNVESRYINLDRRLDRRCHFEKDIIDTKAFGDITIKRFRAFDVPLNGALGCARSHAAALRECLSEPSRKPYFLIMEDDCQLEIPPNELFDAINKLPALRDATNNVILCLSYYPPKIQLQGLAGGPPLCYGCVARATDIQTTSAYVVTRLFAEKGLLPCFEQSVKELARGASEGIAAIDVKWKELQRISHFHVTVPRIIRQRVDRSDIRNKVLDYGGGCEMLLRSSSESCQMWLTSSCFHTTLFPLHMQLLDILTIALEKCPSMRHFFVCLEPQGKFDGTNMFLQWLQHMSPVASRPVALFTPPDLSKIIYGFFISRTLAEEWTRGNDASHDSLIKECAKKKMCHKTQGWISLVC